MKFKTRIRHHFAGQHTFRGRPLLDRYSTVTRPLLDRYATITRPLHTFFMSYRYLPGTWARLCHIASRYLPVALRYKTSIFAYIRTYRAICTPRAKSSTAHTVRVRTVYQRAGKRGAPVPVPEVRAGGCTTVHRAPPVPPVLRSGTLGNSPSDNLQNTPHFGNSSRKTATSRTRRVSSFIERWKARPRPRSLLSASLSCLRKLRCCATTCRHHGASA